jgi:hypothetical protein
MRILVDITHPAYAQFYRHAIHYWQAANHDVLITSREKDLTCNLLDEFGFKHVCIGRAQPSITGLARELAQRSWALNKIVGQFKPDVATAAAGAYLVYGCLPRRVPTVIFYDTEHDRLSNAITYPLAKVVVTPRAYNRDVGKKQIRYPGYHSTAYTHPNQFTPDPSVLREEGLEPGEPFIVVRLVNWKSIHDIGDYGIKNLREVINTLAKYGHVIVSSEKPLPPDLQARTLRGPRQNMLHLQAFARLFFGESATMASECVMLGTPAIFLSTSRRGYIDEQKARYDMVYSFNDPETGQAQALAKARELLEDPTTPARWQAKREQMLAELIDVSAFITDIVLKYAHNTDSD